LNLKIKLKSLTLISTELRFLKQSTLEIILEAILIFNIQNLETFFNHLKIGIVQYYSEVHCIQVKWPFEYWTVHY
jgi:hypothetical protein